MKEDEASEELLGEIADAFALTLRVVGMTEGALAHEIGQPEQVAAELAVAGLVFEEEVARELLNGERFGETGQRSGTGRQEEEALNGGGAGLVRPEDVGEALRVGFVGRQRTVRGKAGLAG